MLAGLAEVEEAPDPDTVLARVVCSTATCPPIIV
jgi:hypothetical protein